MSQWDQVSEQFARLSLAADEAPIGMERVRAHEMALRLAQANQSFAEEFVARIDLTQALYYVPDDPHTPVSYTHLRAHETVLDLVCRLLLENKQNKKKHTKKKMSKLRNTVINIPHIRVHTYHSYISTLLI